MSDVCGSIHPTLGYVCELPDGHEGPHILFDINHQPFAKWYPPAKETRTVVDLVNHPPHYTTGTIEVIDFIEDQRFGYLDGQVIKYVSRARHKGNAKQDYEKARFYLNRLIEQADT